MMQQRLNEYCWIVFDADDTLFHFDAFEGLQQLFKTYGVDFSAEDFAHYQVGNKALWLDYQKGTITAQQVQEQRFQQWGERLHVAPAQLNADFLQAMITVCQPLEGALDLICALKDHVKLGIITNGFTQLQQARLEYHQYHTHFELLVISEQMGVAKPHPDIFKHAEKLMGNPPPHTVLMVGDNPDTDIRGALDVGWHACWLNTHDKPLPLNLKPHYEVKSLRQLQQLLLEKQCD